jgi:hypothetical protein
VKSPTAATIDSATVASMPGTLIKREHLRAAKPELTKVDVEKP